MNDTIDLQRYINLGLKWWWLLILFAVLGAGTGYWYSSQQPRVYQATVTILVGQSIQASDLSASDLILSERLAQTYAEMVRRQPVLQAVTDRLSLVDSWAALRNRVRATPVRDTQLLEITVEASSPEEARVTADELANQLIQLSPTALQNQQQSENRRLVQERLVNLQAKIDSGQERLAELNSSMSGSVSAEQVQEIQAEINDLEQLIAGWEDHHTRLLIFVEGERSPNYLAIIEPAQGSSAPIRPQPTRSGAMAGVVGLMLAAGIVFLIEYLDDTIKASTDFSQLFGLTPLGIITKIKGYGYKDRLVGTDDPFSPVAEAYRIIRSNIQFMSIDHPAKSIMITSATPGEGKSVTTANLARVMAQAGLKTVVVDSDLRRPTQHEIFQIPNLGGLTSLLSTPDPSIRQHLVKTDIEHLFLIPSGVIPPNPSELLGSQRMAQLVKQLEEVADIVLYDSPPAVVVTDAPVLSTRMDGVVLVAHANSARIGAVRQAVENLQHAGANILGGVLNQVKSKRGGYYYHTYGYGHRYGSYSSYAPSAHRNGTGPDEPGAGKAKRRWQWLPFVNRG